MHTSTKELAFCSVMAALGVVLLCLGGIVPFAMYACPLLASMVLGLVRERCRRSYAWCCWAATAVLGLLLGPDKEASALYLFLGYYPLAQPLLDKIRPAVLRWAVKALYFAVSLAAMYGALLYVFRLQAVAEEFAAAAPWLVWLTLLLGAAVCGVYDMALHRANRWYRRRRKG